MTLKNKAIGFYALSTILLFGCGSTAGVLTTPIENIDSSPLKVTELTEVEKKNWGHLKKYYQ